MVRMVDSVPLLRTRKESPRHDFSLALVTSDDHNGSAVSTSDEAMMKWLSEVRRGKMNVRKEIRGTLNSPIVVVDDALKSNQRERPT
jgi:hypothetical protein